MHRSSHDFNYFLFYSIIVSVTSFLFSSRHREHGNWYIRYRHILFYDYLIYFIFPFIYIYVIATRDLIIAGAPFASSHILHMRGARFLSEWKKMWLSSAEAGLKGITIVHAYLSFILF